MSAAASDPLGAAWGYCAQGRFDEAQRLLTQHVQLAPQDIEAWILLAKLCQQRRDPMRALSAAAAAVRLDPTHPEALYMLGRAHRANGTDAAAEECYRRALA